MKISQEGSNIVFQRNGLHIYLHSDINEKPESIFWGTYPICERVIPMSITARGLMIPRFSALNSSYTNPKKQYCEVGPGFSGIFPYLDEIEFEKKPIIIDPAPYCNFLNLLGEIEERLGEKGSLISDPQLIPLIDEYKRDNEYLPRIQRARKNLNWYLNPDNCRFINKTVGDAVVEDDNLIGELDLEPKSVFSAEHCMWGVGTSKRNRKQLENIMKKELGINGDSRFFLSEGDFQAKDVYQLMLKPELRRN